MPEVYDHISLAGIAQRLDHLHKTIECGKHSGIPACCIAFYVTKWMWLPKNKTNSFFKEYWGKLEALWSTYTVEYVPCPKCLEHKSFVKTKECPQGVHCNHRTEQSM